MVATPRSVSSAVQQTTIKVAYAVKPVNTIYLICHLATRSMISPVQQWQ